MSAHPSFKMTRVQKENRYQLYHQSVVDFLGSRLRAGDYWISTHEAHRRVVGYYREVTCTWEEVDRIAVDDYGVLCLAEHLYDLRDLAEYRQNLFALVESQSWTLAKHVNTPWTGSLLGNLRLASDVEARTSLNAWIRAIGYQLRRGLLEGAMSTKSGEHQSEEPWISFAVARCQILFVTR